ncbi:MAG: hypothetical protein ACC619_02460 [Paracoccaceae bacterium]
MRSKSWMGALVALVILAACGNTPLEQALLGAGAGAGTAILLGGNAGTGAVLGAGANLYCQNTTEIC